MNIKFAVITIEGIELPVHFLSLNVEQDQGSFINVLEFKIPLHDYDFIFKPLMKQESSLYEIGISGKLGIWHLDRIIIKEDSVYKGCTIRFIQEMGKLRNRI